MTLLRRLNFLIKIPLLLFLIVFLQSCAVEKSESQNIASIIIENPELKSKPNYARVLSRDSDEIPSEVTQIIFKLSDNIGELIAEYDMLKEKRDIEFKVLPNHTYTLTGSAKASDEILYYSSEIITGLRPGEARKIPISLLPQLQLSLNLRTNDGQAEKPSEIKVPVGTANTSQFELVLDGLQNKNVTWYVNNVAGGNEAVGTINENGEYTPPELLPEDINIQLKVVPEIAPSFNATIDVELVNGPDTQAPVVSINPVGDLYDQAQTITLSCDDCDSIFYSIDNSDVNNIYNEPLNIDKTQTLHFFAVDSANNSSEVEQHTFIIDTEIPISQALPPAGTYNTSQEVTLTCGDCSAIYYTLGDETPDINSALYSSKIPITSDQTIQYFAVDLAGNREPTNTANYVIEEILPDGPKVLSIFPENNQTNVDIKRNSVDITFNKAIKNPSISGNNIIITGPDGAPVKGVLTFDSQNNQISFLPSTNWLANTTYEITVTTGILDGAGTPLDQNYNSRFTTRLPNLSYADVTVIESTGNADVIVTLDVVSSSLTTVEYKTTNDTASIDKDFTTASGTLIFAIGETSKTITIDINDDNIYETQEKFFINFENPIAVTIENPQVVVTINDNETEPSLTINDVTVNEALPNATITATLSGPSAFPVTLNYASENNTAIAGNDYSESSGTIQFTVGETTQTFLVPILSDELSENNESFFINFSNISGAQLENNQNQIIITDNGLPSLSINNITVNEADEDATITLSLSEESGQLISLDFTTTDNTAIAGQDYIAHSGSINFLPGETNKTIVTSIVNDDIFENDEQFFIDFSNVNNVNLINNSVQLNITDDETKPQLSVEDVVVDEAGNTANVTFTLSHKSQQIVSVDYATSDITTDATQDYVSQSKKIVFQPEQLSATIAIDIVDDALYESNEQLSIIFSNPSENVTLLNTQANITINDNDPQPSLSINDVTIIESASVAQLQISLNTASGVDTTISFSTEDNTAIAPTDYEAIDNNSITLLAGETQKSISLIISNDDIAEGSEIFYVTLNNANAATISKAQGSITIENDDFLISSIFFEDANMAACVNNSVAISIHDLTTLNCTSDNITNLTGIEFLVNLQNLDLSDNSISDISALANLTALRTLDLFGGNSISDIGALANLTALTDLRLSSNISDISALINLTALTRLYLNINTISDISALANLTALTDLRLSSNNISDISALANLIALTDLRLQENNISDISALANLTALRTLDLHSNSISDISALANLTALRTLDLHSNSISNISALANLTALTDLGLSNNNISDISALVNLSALRFLNLHSNSISDISALANLTTLRTLDLGNNSISNISALVSLTALRILYLGHNVSDISALANLTALRTLYLFNNNISDISALANLTALTTLNLSYNNISDISALVNLTALTDLGLSNNNISDISALANLTALSTLDLFGDNNINDISALANLTALTDLRLSNNSISDISALANLTALTDLRLTSNISDISDISDISALANLTALTRLYLNNNNISDISALANLTALTDLRLSSNNISDISALANLIALTDLSLFYNSISDISALANLTDLTNLYLNNNNISIGVIELENIFFPRIIDLDSNSELICSDIEYIDSIFDNNNGNNSGIVTWTTCTQTPNVPITAQGSPTAPLLLNTGELFFHQSAQVDNTSSYYEINVTPEYSYRITIDNIFNSDPSNSIQSVSYKKEMLSTYADCSQIDETFVCVITNSNESIFLKVDGPNGDLNYSTFDITAEYNPVRDPLNPDDPLSILASDIVDLKGQVTFGSPSPFGGNTGDSRYYVTDLIPDTYYKIQLSGVEDNVAVFVDDFGFTIDPLYQCNLIGTKLASEVYCIIKTKNTINQFDGLSLTIDGSFGIGTKYILNLTPIPPTEVFHFSSYCATNCNDLSYVMFLEDNPNPFSISTTGGLANNVYSKYVHLISGENIYIEVSDPLSTGDKYIVHMGDQLLSSPVFNASDPDEFELNNDDIKSNATTLGIDVISDHSLSVNNENYGDVDWLVFTAP